MATKGERREAKQRKSKRMRVHGLAYVRIVTRILNERATGKRGPRN